MAEPLCFYSHPVFKVSQTNHKTLQYRAPFVVVFLSFVVLKYSVLDYDVFLSSSADHQEYMHLQHPSVGDHIGITTSSDDDISELMVCGSNITPEVTTPSRLVATCSIGILYYATHLRYI